MNRENLAFVVHVGDIKGGRGSCRDEVFQVRKRQFEHLRHAFVLLPGDNDWTDCHRAKEDPTEALVSSASGRQTFFSAVQEMRRLRPRP